MMLTIWMLNGRQTQGATVSDIGLKDELTKPWMTLVNFHTHFQQFKWSWRSLFRCLQETQFAVKLPDGGNSSTPTFSVGLASVPLKNFTGAMCHNAVAAFRKDYIVPAAMAGAWVWTAACLGMDDCGGITGLYCIAFVRSISKFTV